jgi:hypothetical protein
MLTPSTGDETRFGSGTMDHKDFIPDNSILEINNLSARGGAFVQQTKEL